MDKVRVWHFARDDKCLGHGDKRKIVVGQPTRYRGHKLIMCKRGMHGSRKITDALQHAAGAYICCAELSGDLLRSADKFCAEYRKVLWSIDGTKVLYHFARLCALDVVDLWRAPEIVVRFLRTGNEALRMEATTAAWAEKETIAAAAWAIEAAGVVGATRAWKTRAAMAAKVVAGASRAAMGAAGAMGAAWATEAVEAEAKQEQRLRRMVYNAHRDQ